MWNYETGEPYPCPNCKRLECNGCFKKEAVEARAMPERKFPELKGNDAFKRFVQQTAQEVTESHKKLSAAVELGRKGGLKTAQRGSAYFSGIAKLRRRK